MQKSGALEQIRKLLKLANDAGATDSEAQAALGRAKHLASKFTISAVEVERATRSDGTVGVRINIDPGKMVKRTIYSRSNLTRWDKWLLSVAAKASNTGGYINFTGLVLYGLPEDVAVGEALYEFARSSMSKCARRWAKEQRNAGRDWIQSNTVEVRSYKDGFCKGLFDALKKPEPEDRVKLNAGNQMALVLVSDLDKAKQGALEVYKRGLGLGRGRRSRARTHSERGYLAGRDAGRSTSLSKGVVK